MRSFRDFMDRRDSFYVFVSMDIFPILFPKNFRYRYAVQETTSTKIINPKMKFVRVFVPYHPVNNGGVIIII